MSIVRFLRASFAFDSRDVLADLDLTFDVGFTGVVGENGGGKTTLLRLIAGELSPTSGEVIVGAARADRLLCRQRVDERHPWLVAFSQCYDRDALRWQARLGVGHLDIDGYDTWSPGERKRWQIAAALWRQPRILLLDEPTNHLDAAGRARLLDALGRYDGVGIAVSHDRELLDALCPRTIRLRGGRAQTFALPYSEAREAWLAERAASERAHSLQRAQLAKDERLRARMRDRRHRAERQLSARHRMKGPRDSDARSVNARARAEAAEARLSRGVAMASGRVERANERVVETRVDRVRGSHIEFRGRVHPRRWLARVEGDLRAGDRLLASGCRFELERDSRIGIRGDNGAGKTTLVHRLLAATDLPADDILYVPQLLTATHERELRAAIELASPEHRSRVMTLAATLGLDPDRVIRSRSYSPGELRKLLIAVGLARDVCLLVLDEPTNHLDLPSVERLEAALRDFGGALVVVTHDSRLADALELETWSL